MESLVLRRQRVYDPVLRMIHAWNALLVFFLLVTSQLADRLELSWQVPAIWRFHLWCGYLLVVGFIARVVWGLVGPQPARWSALWQPGAWWKALRSGRLMAPPGAFGHHRLASAMYLGFYAMLATMVVTGLALAAIDQAQGPLYQWLGYDVLLKPYFREPHEFLQYLILAFVVVHIAALIVHERLHRLPVAQAMVSGYQYRTGEDEE
jgi:Ni/Fe-hydrogenase 1 B-type cytochrome subunit